MRRRLVRMSDHAYLLALEFDSDNPEFVRGAELGALWERLKEHPYATVEQTVHLTNAEMVLRVSEALGRPVVSEEHADGHWMTVRFEPAT